MVLREEDRPEGRARPGEGRRPGLGDPLEADASRAAFLLAVRRPPDDPELPDVWGLPAGTLREGEGWEDAVRRAGREKLGVELRVGEVLREGTTEREGYTLRMRLYRAEVAGGEPQVARPVPGITQYAAWEWAPPERLRDAARRGSLCSRLCLAWLDRS